MNIHYFNKIYVGGGAVSPHGHDFSSSCVACTLCVAMAAGKALGFHFQDDIVSTDAKVVRHHATDYVLV